MGKDTYIKKEQPFVDQKEEYQYQYKTPNSKLDQTKKSQYDYNSLKYQKELKEKQNAASEENKKMDSSFNNNHPKEKIGMMPVVFLLTQILSAFLGFVLGMLVAFIICSSGSKANTQQISEHISSSQSATLVE